MHFGFGCRGDFRALVGFGEAAPEVRAEPLFFAGGGDSSWATACNCARAGFGLIACLVAVRRAGRLGGGGLAASCSSPERDATEYEVSKRRLRTAAHIPSVAKS